MFAVLLVGLYTSRITLRELGLIDYGLMSVVTSLLTIFTFIQGSLSAAASRFFSFELGRREGGDLHKIFCIIQNIFFGFSILVLIVAETAGLWYFYNKMIIPADRMSACLIVYQLSIVSAIYTILVIPYNAMIIAQERMGAFAYLSIVNVVGRLVMAYILCITPIDKLITFALLTFALNFYIRILYVRYCNKHFRESKYEWLWDKAVFKDIAVYTGWSVVANSRSFIDQASNLLINLFFGPVVNAARSVANTIQSAVYGFVLNFQIAVNPQITKNYAANETNKVHEIVELSQKISFSLFFVILLPLLSNLDAVLDLWLVEVPEYTQPLLMINSLSILFLALANPLSVIPHAANRLKMYNLTTMPVYLLSLPVSYFILKMGASVITLYMLMLSIEILSFILHIHVANKICSISLRSQYLYLVKVVLSIICAAGIIYYMMNYFENGLVAFLEKATISASYAIVWLWIVILNRQDRMSVKNLIISKAKQWI